MYKNITFLNLLMILFFGSTINIQALGFPEDVTASDLGIKQPWLLPNSPFYFLKEIKRFFTPIFILNQNPVYQAELHLEVVKEKLMEAKILSEKDKISDRAVVSAIKNYQKELEKFKTRIEKLEDKIKSEKVEAEKNKFLKEIIEPFVKISVVLEGINNKRESSEVRDTFVENIDLFNLVLEKTSARDRDKGIKEKIGEFYEEFSDRNIAGKNEDVKEELRILGMNTGRISQEEVISQIFTSSEKEKIVSGEKEIVKKEVAVKVTDKKLEVGKEAGIKKEEGSCPQVYRPVCGADSRTYNNRCEVTLAGAEIAYRGICKESIVSDCQDQCPMGIQVCSAGGYRICGNYDEDGCSELSSIFTCPAGTLCQNGSCIQQKCSDATLYGQCSMFKPKYCEGGSLVDRATICGCPTGYGINELNTDQCIVKSEPPTDETVTNQYNAAIALLQEEVLDFTALAHTFPLFSHFEREKEAALFSIIFASLPSHLVSWDADTFKKFIITYFGDWVQNLESPNYQISKPGVMFPTPPYDSSIDDFCSADTILHEYAHVLDKRVSWLPELAVVDTNGFYSISFDIQNPYYDSYGTYYSVRRSDNIYNEFVTNYAIYGGARTPLRNDKFVPWEDFAESFSMYVTQGIVFRELAQLDLFIRSKYDFIKQVFQGKEYNTGDIRGFTAVRKLRAPSNEILPASKPCDYTWRAQELEWGYKL